MSGTLDTTALFETFAQNKEVNLPPDAKKRAYEMEKRANEKTIDEIQPKKSLTLEEQIARLKEENTKLKKSLNKTPSTKKKSKEFTKNEEKVLNAIKSEILNQKRKNPIITRKDFKFTHKINSKFLDTAINGLLAKKKIRRIPINYTAKIKTFSWELI